MRGGSGAQGRNRTTDTAIFSRMLYQLSYLGDGCLLTDFSPAINTLSPHPTLPGTLPVRTREGRPVSGTAPYRAVGWRDS